jgi:hypothetical protein
MGDDLERARQRRRAWSAAVLGGLLLFVLLALQLVSCAHSEDLQLHTTQARSITSQPWTLDRTIHGRVEWLRPDGGVRKRAELDTQERTQSDGGFITEDTGLDLRAREKTAPAIPIFRMAGALAALAVGAYFFIRWRIRSALPQPR